MTTTPPNPKATPQNWRFAAPNALTILRLILAFIFVAILSTFSPDADLSDTAPSFLLIAAAILFTTAALTDALDGHLARKWNAITPFGRVMDPFADKILILAAFILLAAPPFTSQDNQHQLSAIQPWMAILILARELLVTSIRGVVEGAGGTFPATASGKAKMVIQSIAVPLILLTLAFPSLRNSIAHWLLPTTAWTITIITLWSALPYILKARQALSTNPNQRAKST